MMLSLFNLNKALLQSLNIIYLVDINLICNLFDNWIMAAKKTSRNCWDYISCSDSIRFNCPAYKNRDGKGCYLYCQVITSSSRRSELTKNLPGCTDCSWFKELIAQ